VILTGVPACIIVGMNTFTLVHRLLESALRLAGPTKRIVGLTVSIGQLSGIREEDLRSEWERQTVGTAAQGAQLDVQYLPAEFSCMICRRLFRTEQEDPACPYCGSLGVKIEHGEECLLQFIKLDDGTRLP
jgi:hydrogenase nickel incorporation protein HypA/HybF